MEILHVCLNVADADRAVDWYTAELDFEKSWEFTLSGTRHVYVADENGTELQLSEAGGAVETGTAWDHLAVDVADVDAAVERIDHHGLVDGPRDVPQADARVAFVEDPDGHVVELIEPFE